MKYWIFIVCNGIPYPILVGRTEDEAIANQKAQGAGSIGGFAGGSLRAQAIASYVVYASANTLPYPFFANGKNKRLLFIDTYDLFLAREEMLAE